MLLSIVVPVYNVEKYIVEFCDKLLPQINENVEVVFINDGCKDDSVKLIHKKNNLLNEIYKDNIVVLNQINQGQSVARNNGIKISRGVYIGFLDPDDYVEKNYIEKILTLLKTEPDVLSFGANVFLDTSGKKVGEIYTNLPEGYHLVSESLLNKIYKECSWMPWLRVVKKNIIEKYNFPKNILLEDVYLFIILYLNINNLYHTNDILVNYRLRDNSSVGSKKDLFFESYEIIINYVIEERNLNIKLFDVTYNKLLKAYIKESLYSRGFKFAYLNLIKYKIGVFLLLELIFVVFIYLLKKILRK